MTKAKKQNSPDMTPLIFAVSELSALLRESCMSVSASGRIVSWIDDTPNGYHISIAIDDNGEVKAELQLWMLDPVRMYAVIGFCHQNCASTSVEML